LFNQKVVMLMKLQDTTKLSELTVADLRDLLYEIQSGNTQGAAKPTGRLVYGLNGIRELFHCSHKQAQYYKDNVIKGAVSQNGRKIVVDVDKALELFNQRGQRHA